MGPEWDLVRYMGLIFKPFIGGLLKKIWFGFILFLILPLLQGFTHIPQGATEQTLQEAQKAQTLILERRYPEAKQYFLELSQKYPDSPLGSFSLMALYNAIMFENFDFSLVKEFEKASEKNEALVDKIAKDDKATAWELFLCGASSGLRGFYLIRQDKALGALGQGNQAKKCLERALEKDPKFFDVYLGLGMYEYWRSIFTRSIKILPFFKDNRAKGFAMVKKSIDKGIVAQDLGRASLMFMYLEDYKNAQGLQVTQELLKKYPQNVIAKVHQGRFLKRMRKNQEAIKVFDEVLKEHPEISVAIYFKAESYRRMGMRDKAEKMFKEYLATKPSPPWQAYTYHHLGLIALEKKKRKEALEYFKTGSSVYGKYKANLRMVLKMRRGQR